ncbi:hypothetical protein [Dokdonella koreensis]|uniref:Uncharacterized protein n=1 Tax=Dokdonella koreensis DS-123 TaxID=1300342 RepID=A0A160DTM3_9GAMM|nr:hypothetical protein [Dokdonella koreensis]ANB17340.1 Hypothetical protein I596_1310 [Dokdonella koreensis DS-123]
MRDSAVPVKTTSGRNEVADRSRQLGSRQRMLLIAINGEHTVREIRERFHSLGDVDALLDELAVADLIDVAGAGVPAAPASDPPGPAFDAASPLVQARQYINDSVVAHLGLRAFLFTLKVERCYSRQALLDLLPEYRRLLGKTLDPAAIAALNERAERMIARL